MLSLTTLKSKEFTLSSDSFEWGRGDHHQFSLYLPISWLFRMGSHWPHWKVKSSLMSSDSFKWGRGDHRQFSLYLPISWLFRNGLSLTALKTKEFTLSSDSFEWGRGDQHQFSLYLPISWLFQMSSHWPHWKVKSLLWALAVSNGGDNQSVLPR